MGRQPKKRPHHHMEALDRDLQRVADQYLVTFEATVQHTNFDGSHLSWADPVKFSLPQPIKIADLEAGLLSAAGLNKADFHRVLITLAKVNICGLKYGRIFVDDSGDWGDDNDLVLESMDGCCMNQTSLVSPFTSGSAQVACCIATMARPAQLQDAELYAALQLSRNDPRNDWENSFSWQVEILQVARETGEFARTYYRAPKTRRKDEVELMSAADAVKAAVLHAQPGSTGKCTLQGQELRLHAFEMLGGEMKDTSMRVARHGGRDHLIWNQGTHYDDTRWNQVYCNVTAGNVPSEWTTLKGVSPYCDALCVPTQAEDLFHEP